MTEQELPKGWSVERIEAVIAHYDSQSEDEELAELEAAWEAEDSAMVQVPNELLPAVRELISTYESLKSDLRAS